MVGSDKRHGEADIIMMWQYSGYMVGRFSILRGHKGPNQGGMCHHSQGEMSQRMKSHQQSTIGG